MKMASTSRLAHIARILPYALVGVAAAYLYSVAANIEYHARPGTLGPDFWPKAILALTIALCVYEVIKISIFGAGSRDAGGVLDGVAPENTDPEAGAAQPEVGPSYPVLLLAGMAATLAYVWASQRLGFFLATIVYLVVFIRLGGYRRWGVIAAVSILGTLTLLFIFMKLVYVSLPIGVEPFSQVTILLMRLLGIR